MHKKLPLLIVIFVISLFMSGCLVTQGTYMKKATEADSLQKKYDELATENSTLKDKTKKLTEDRDQLKEAFANATSNLTDMRQKIADLEAENTKMKENIAELKKKEVEAQTESNTYKQLMQEMKSEVAKGQVTISELKGKLTLDVVDKILFASGRAEVTKEGLAVLKRVIDILKNVQDKAIRIEGHTDNVRIKGSLVRQYPTNWELSAARAINITKCLQQQGIPATLLSAAAFGEYKPLAGNNTSEGRAKNRRIAIILLPKD
jgi:chemotaxis protein MotB